MDCLNLLEISNTISKNSLQSPRISPCRCFTLFLPVHYYEKRKQNMGLNESDAVKESFIIKATKTNLD